MARPVSCQSFGWRRGMFRKNYAGNFLNDFAGSVFIPIFIGGKESVSLRIPFPGMNLNYEKWNTFMSTRKV